MAILIDTSILIEYERESPPKLQPNSFTISSHPSAIL